MEEKQKCGTETRGSGSGNEVSEAEHLKNLHLRESGMEKAHARATLKEDNPKTKKLGGRGPRFKKPKRERGTRCPEMQ